MATVHFALYANRYVREAISEVGISPGALVDRARDRLVAAGVGCPFEREGTALLVVEEVEPEAIAARALFIERIASGAPYDVDGHSTCQIRSGAVDDAVAVHEHRGHHVYCSRIGDEDRGLLFRGKTLGDRRFYGPAPLYIPGATLERASSIVVLHDGASRVPGYASVARAKATDDRGNENIAIVAEGTPDELVVHGDLVREHFSDRPVKVAEGIAEPNEEPLALLERVLASASA